MATTEVEVDNYIIDYLLNDDDAVGVMKLSFLALRHVFIFLNAHELERAAHSNKRFQATSIEVAGRIIKEICVRLNFMPWVTNFEPTINTYSTIIIPAAGIISNARRLRDLQYTGFFLIGGSYESQKRVDWLSRPSRGEKILFGGYQIRSVAVAAGKIILPSMHHERQYVVIAEKQGEVFAIGSSGRSGEGTMERYNVMSRSWTILRRPLPQKFWGLAAGVLDNTLIITGGSYKTADDETIIKSLFSDPYAFDQQQQEVSASALATTTLAAAASKQGSGRRESNNWVVSGRAYFLKEHVSLDPAEAVWVLMEGSLCTPRRFHASAVVQGKLIVAGGIDAAGQKLSSVEEYDQSSKRWNDVAGMLEPRCNFHLVVVNSELYAVGGTSDTSSSIEKLVVHSHSMNTPSWTWRAITTFPDQRKGCAVAVDGSSITLIGGGIKDILSTTWDSFDVVAEKWDSSKAALANPESRRLFPEGQGVYNGQAVYLPSTITGSSSGAEAKLHCWT